MHIVYVTAPGGGPEAYIKTLLPWLEQQGHHVSVVYTVRSVNQVHAFPSNIRTEFAAPGSLHYYLGKIVGNFRSWPRRLRIWEGTWAVYQALRRIDLDEPIEIIEATEGLIVSLLRLWPVVIRAHGSDWTFRYFCRDGDSRHDKWLIALEARQLRKARAVSAISRHLAQHLSEFCYFPLDQIEIIPYPIDIHTFSPGCGAEMASQPPVLLTIGRLEKRKGVDVLLHALSAKVWKYFPELKVYLVGSEAGLTKADLLALVPPDKRGQVIFPGFVDRFRITGYYQRANVYVAPTLYETFGYTVLESMACGVPVVASRVGAIPELVDDGVTGLLVPPGDPEALAEAIIYLLSDSAQREQMGKRAREKAVTEYAVEKIGPRLLAFYERALGRK
jgi:glycosyltransferase involved in cell wall biosynthesis